MAKQKWKDTVMGLLYPPRCIFCDEVVRPGETCAQCASAVDELKLKGNARRITGGPERQLSNLDVVIASFVYTGPVAEAVARYKFSGRPDLYRDMARYMAADVADLLDAQSIDLVLDVPSYKDKGEHAKLLAKGVAEILKRPYDANTLTKVRKTPKQHDQVYRLRYENIRDAFGVSDGADVKGKTVLLCDDVMTSGHTLNECAAALKAAGAVAVYGCTFSASRPR